MLLLVVMVYTIFSFLAPLLLILEPECDGSKDPTHGKPRLNPDYLYDPCLNERRPVLIGMSPWEADMNVRVVMSLACGSLIGFERRRADRAAGIRTMALVCLGACVFTVASTFAFIAGPMAWDASRVSAAIPSGVGFLGAASIWKGTRAKDPKDNDKSGPSTVPEVHGLTTATSVWLSSAVGILVGGKLYSPALFTTAISVVYLRFAPRLPKGGGAALLGTNSHEADLDREAIRAPLIVPSPGAAQADATPNAAAVAGAPAGRKPIAECSSLTQLHI